MAKKPKLISTLPLVTARAQLRIIQTDKFKPYQKKKAFKYVENCINTAIRLIGEANKNMKNG